ncbi:DUF739 family protein [Eremococcus coleocola]|uniref:DUF739 family protein n=1 Tax=Eremococcus coleocola TaxID=88132 RepID=UPI0004889B52|nr:DUF739 family protein [Eremococcus coleocola]
MSFDFSKLYGKIREVYGTQEAFANAMGFSERTLSLKLNNKVSWKTTEAGKACELLGLELNEIPEYFFKI